MLMTGTLRRLLLLLLLLADTCLRVYGNPVHLPNLTPVQDAESKPSDAGHVSGPVPNVGAGGGAGPGPGGIGPVTQTENGDGLDGRSGPSAAGGEAKEVGSASATGDARGRSEAGSVAEERGESDVAFSAPRPAPDGLSASPAAPEQLELNQERRREGGEGGTNPPGDGDSPRGAGTSWPPPTEPPDLPVHGPTRHSPVPPSVFASPRTPTSLPMWGHEGATIPALPEPLLPEIGPNLVPREESLESLWTEAARPSGADTAAPPSQDEATEGTMSSEALPLIFEPFEDAAPEGGTPVPGRAQPPAAMATRGAPPSEAGLSPSQAPPPPVPDWTSLWQTSGVELPEPVSVSVPSASRRGGGTEDPSEEDAVRTQNLEGNLPTSGPSLSSFERPATTVTMATHQPVHKFRSGLEEMESEEEPDEDEEDDNSEESVEEESEEDLAETAKSPLTQPPYSLIPPPPVWVQRNQGLMRSWVELIREKAGYVSGMLAPVGIGITGALLIVGALYSIRMIHRKRRNSFKHQRRKVRQPEQPREPTTSRQDQAMLLADSSEDEF